MTNKEDEDAEVEGEEQYLKKYDLLSIYRWEFLRRSEEYKIFYEKITSMPDEERYELPEGFNDEEDDHCNYDKAYYIAKENGMPFPLPSD